MSKLTHEALDERTVRLDVDLTVIVGDIDWDSDVFEQFLASVQEEAFRCVMKIFACDSCLEDLDDESVTFRRADS